MCLTAKMKPDQKKGSLGNNGLLRWHLNMLKKIAMTYDKCEVV